MQAKRSVPAPRRSQLTELDSCRARVNRFTIAPDARSRDPGPTTPPDRANVDSERPKERAITPTVREIRRMSAESVTSSLDVVAPAAQQSRGTVALVTFLALTLLLPTMIVIGNCVLGVLTPITDGAEDEMSRLDGVWRLVQGQHLGIDFHDPLGFGFFQVAAVLWRLLGPHHYILWASSALFALVIVCCGCVVAIRQLRDAVGLAALFCITVAFVASGPSIYGFPHCFSFCMSYDRLYMSGLLVLFLQSFANDLDARRERGYIDHFTAAVLLNTILLVKISGLVVGIAIVVLGLILRGPLWRSLSGVSVILLFLAVIMTMDFILTGNSLYPVIREYGMAAQGRVGAISALDILRFASRLPVLVVVLLMALYAISRPNREGSKNPLRRCFCIIAFYWVCQVVLNVSNAALPDLIYLAPAVAVCVVTWMDTPDLASFWNRLWTRFHPRRLNEFSARQLLPLLVIAMVCVPEVGASMRAAHISYLASLGTIETMTVSANRGIMFKIRKDSTNGLLVPYLNRAIHAIESLGASGEKIAMLDFANPFPALFLAPDPKGVWLWWDFSRTTNVPIGYLPGWQEIIGDACIVTQPKHSPTEPVKNYSEPLIKAVEPRLATAFTIVYEDELWKVWKLRRGCSGPEVSQVKMDY